MLNLVSFVEKKVIETAEMLNMSSFGFFGTYREDSPVSSKKPNV